MLLCKQLCHMLCFLFDKLTSFLKQNRLHFLYLPIIVKLHLMCLFANNGSHLLVCHFWDWSILTKRAHRGMNWSNAPDHLWTLQATCQRYFSLESRCHASEGAWRHLFRRLAPKSNDTAATRWTLHVRGAFQRCDIAHVVWHRVLFAHAAVIRVQTRLELLKRLLLQLQVVIADFLPW